jgi:hypothetical protein
MDRLQPARLGVILRKRERFITYDVYNGGLCASCLMPSRRFNNLDEGFQNNVEKQTEQPLEKDKDYQWLLKEASWQEFWLLLDQLVDWNQKRKEIEGLNCDQSNHS